MMTDRHTTRPKPINRPEEEPFRAKGQQAKAIHPQRHCPRVLDTPRPGDSIHPIDYQSLFNFLYFTPAKKTENKDWVPIAASNRLAPAHDFVCPHCNELIHADVTGNMRCLFCGEPAHPVPLRWHGKDAAEHSSEKRHTLDLNRF